MSGGFIPYHLRHNKSIDREVFFEGLLKLSRILPIDDYIYIGFGGPMLEDFRHLHHKTYISHMISLEEDPNVFKRQLYNKPYSSISCQNAKSTDFIDSYSFDKKSIFWLDYASPKAIYSQLTDIETLSTKVSDGDILKVTFPINPLTVYTRGVKEPIESYRENFNKRLYEILSKKFINYDFTVDEKNISSRKIIGFLSDVIIDSFKNSVERGLSSRREELTFIPLVVNSYNDSSHTMLTIFGIYRLKSFYRETLELTNLNCWPFISNHWHDIQEISIPSLTIKEKIELDSKLPSFKDYYTSAKNISINDSDIKNYHKYYRLYPNFQRVMV
ncbi:TPA: hypothetical protein PXM35_000064 [Yersinia enterocolitica]|nr:hypothetical protein [Yersinia enterocolitica]